VVIDGMIVKCYLCFYLYTCFCYEFFVLARERLFFGELSEVSKFRVNSLSIFYHCAKHNLPTLIDFWEYFPAAIVTGKRVIKDDCLLARGENYNSYERQPRILPKHK